MIKVFPERICQEPFLIHSFVDLEVWRDEIIQEGQRVGLPIEVELDQMKVGRGLSAIGAEVHDCIAVYHRNHKRTYYSHVFIVISSGSRNYVSIYLGGDSRNYRNSLTGGAFTQARAKIALDEEHRFYDAVKDVVIDALVKAEGRRPQRYSVPPVSPPRPTPQPKPQLAPRPVPRPQSTASRPSGTTPVPQSAQEKIFFTCSKCGKKFRIQKRNVRIAFTCTQCGHKFGVNCATGKVQ